MSEVTGRPIRGASREHTLAPKFALVTMSHKGQFFKRLSDGAKTAAAKAGVELVVFNTSDSPSGQNDAIESCTRSRIQGIIIAALDVNRVMSAVRAAAAAGIPVVAVDAILPAGTHKAQIAVDSATAGGMVGRHFLDYVAKSGGEANLGIICALNSPNQNIRRQGFEAVVAGQPGVNITQVVDGRDNLELSVAAAETLLAGKPTPTALYATGEVALFGAIAAVERLGKQDEVKIFGWDLSAQAIKGIDAGYVVAVAQQDPVGMGAAAVIALTTLNKGGSIKNTISASVNIVTRANVDPYRAVFAQC